MARSALRETATHGREVARQFIDFVNETGSPYHAVAASVRLLQRGGFQELSDGGSWTLQRGGKYFVTKGGSDIMAFVVGGKFSASGRRFLLQFGLGLTPMQTSLLLWWV
eukprot:TRINITY_DN41224_c0_g1_i2.p2 TRINITY_DN41224_c0_g1~~TRINITY_DN41224_c0_g1_i2.p2  ORF type:complete len:109 (-),score=29.63 TRINITY_DN41224_c0_g1_i2:30-356(-)